MHCFPRDPLTGTLVRRERNYANQRPNQAAPPGTAAGRARGLFAKFFHSACWKDASLAPHRPRCSTVFPCIAYSRRGFWPNDPDLLQVLSCCWAVIFGKCLTPSGLCHWQTGDGGRQLRYRPEHTLTNCKRKEIMRYLITIKTCCFLLSPKHTCSLILNIHTAWSWRPVKKQKQNTQEITALLLLLGDK